MALRADFDVVTFNSHLGDNAADLDVPWATFHGDQTPEMEFFIGSPPADTGYLLIQVFSVQNAFHRILINGQDLGGVDLRMEDRWQTWMDLIGPDILRQGTNTIQVRRAAGGDNIVISSIAVHWRERV